MGHIALPLLLVQTEVTASATQSWKLGCPARLWPDPVSGAQSFPWGASPRLAGPTAQWRQGGLLRRGAGNQPPSWGLGLAHGHAYGLLLVKARHAGSRPVKHSCWDVPGGLCASKAGGAGSVLGQEAKILPASRCRQKIQQSTPGAQLSFNVR